MAAKKKIESFKNAAPKKKALKKTKPKKELLLAQSYEPKAAEIKKQAEKPKFKKKYMIIVCIALALAALGSFFLIGKENVTTERSLPVKEYAKAAVGIACADKCGDNVCDEIVCMAEACPCSENYRTCPNDCYEARFEDLKKIAKGSECLEKGELTENYAFNPETRTWWINMKMKPEFENKLCNPVCIISEDEDNVELNWRCTGAVPE